MHRTFRYPLYPTSAQEPALLATLDLLRGLYNAALQERRDAWRLQHKSISYQGQTRSLTEIRANDPAFGNGSVEIQRSALRRVQRAFDGFFRRCKSGETPGFPRFKGRGRYESFSFPCGKTTITGDGRSARLRIPSIGEVKVNLYRPLKGKSLEVTIRLDPIGNWYAYVSCDLGAAPEPLVASTIDPADVVGVDMGITAVATFSDGTKLDNPRFFEKSQADLARQQQAIARRRPGSKSRKRAVKQAARTNAHIKNQKLDLYRKSACEVVRQYKVIAFEDLNIAGLAQSMLGKHVNLASWRLYQQLVACKAEEAGRLVVGVDPRYTSQDCSGCERRVEKDLSERWHHCDACGTSLDRDVNAALNIKARGLQALGMSAVSDAVVKIAAKARRSRKTRGDGAAGQV
jgi:putative transposase